MLQLRTLTFLDPTKEVTATEVQLNSFDLNLKGATHSGCSLPSEFRLVHPSLP